MITGGSRVTGAQGRVRYEHNKLDVRGKGKYGYLSKSYIKFNDAARQVRKKPGGESREGGDKAAVRRKERTEYVENYAPNETAKLD